MLQIETIIHIRGSPIQYQHAVVQVGINFPKEIEYHQKYHPRDRTLIVEYTSRECFEKIHN